MIQQDMLAQLSVERAWQDIAWLSQEVPERLSGSSQEERAATYLRDQLVAAGIPSQIHRLPGLVSFPEKCQVEVLSGEGVTGQFTGMTFAQSGSTPSEGVDGELIYIGPGSEKDYKDKDVRGKIVLASLSYAPPRPEKVRLATIHGARALILINWGPPDNPSVPMGTVKAVWGNPTPDTLPLMPSLPAVGISRVHGEQLLRAMEHSVVRVRLHARATREWRTILLPEGMIEAAGPEQEHFILLGGHYDAWGGGATDNATGNATVLELARVLAANRDRLRRSVRVVFWPGHENGIMEGSTWFVDRFWDNINQHAILYLNLDSPGMKGTSRWFIWSSPETRHWHQGVEQAVEPEIEVEWRKLPKIGDQSFFGVGVPAMFPLNQFSEEQIAQWNGAIFAPWYQSTDDTIDKADPTRLAEALCYYAGYLIDLCTRPVLPFEFGSVAGIFAERLDELMSGGAPADLNFDALRRMAETLHRRTIALGEIAENVNLRLEHQDPNGLSESAEADLLNATLMKLSRTLTHALSTVSGRYDQDTYGLSALEHAVPGLHDAEQLASLESDSEEYHLLWTRAIRQRNRVADALRESIKLISHVSEQLD